MRAPFALVLPLALALAACASDPAPADAPADAPTAATPAAPSAPAVAPDPSLPVMTVYKAATCGCCVLWADHLRANGFRVEEQDVEDMTAVKRQYGIPDTLEACHTGIVDGYVVEGHVPAEDVKRLLQERPEAGGLAVPGMPIGSPGMEVETGQVEPYAVYLIDDGQATVYARHGG